MKNFGNLVVVGIIGLIFLSVISNKCSERSTTTTTSYKEEGLDKVIKSLRDESDFTVILYDMNAEGNDYLHKYQILTPEPDSTIQEEVTNWYDVSERFFQQNIDNLGMELAQKSDGQLSKQVAPAGYSQYVGNPQYGQWRQRDGNSFWEFYGKFAMMSTVFNLMSRPAYYNSYNDYNRNYRGSSRAYYGRNNYYGTQSYTSSTQAGRSTTWGSKPQSFKQDVRSRVSRSSTSRSRSATTTRTTRSSNRYSGSSYRSRGGSFGK